MALANKGSAVGAPRRIVSWLVLATSWDPAPVSSRNEGPKRVSMTWRAICDSSYLSPGADIPVGSQGAMLVDDAASVVCWSLLRGGV
jgi:hypothetical protein